MSWWAFGSVLCLAVPYFLWPDDGSVPTMLLACAPIPPAVLVMIRLGRERLLRSSPWVFLAGGVGLYAAATLAWGLGRTLYVLRFPSPVDLAFFGAYLLWSAFFVAVLMQSTRDRVRRTLSGLVDAGIFTCAGLAVLWPSVIAGYLADPTVTGSAELVAVGYPVLLAFVLGLATHVAVSRSLHGAAGALLLLWISAELSSSLPYAFLSIDGAPAVGHATSLGWFVSYAALAAFAVHLDLRAVTVAERGRPANRARGMWLLAAGPLAPIVMLLLGGAEEGPQRSNVETAETGLLVLTLAAFGLVFARLHLLSGDLAYQRRLARRLAKALFDLQTQRDQLARYAAVIASTDESVVTTDMDGTIIDWNPGAERLYGYRAEEVLGQPVSMLMAPERRDRLSGAIASVLENGHGKFEGVDVRKDGSLVEVALSVSVVEAEAATPIGLVAISRDITEAKRAERQAAEDARRLAAQAEELARLAFRDPLTGLANRALLMDRLSQAVSSRSDSPAAVLLIDLDNFKNVNDVLGHAAGDRLLMEVASRLNDCVRSGDTVARLGGDEFAIVLIDSREPASVVQRVVEALHRPAHLEGRDVNVGGSVGGVLKEDDMSAVEMLRRADIAMYASKRAGKGRFEWFRPEMLVELKIQTDLQAQVQRAVQRQEIGVHYQPIISTHAGRTVRVEALARWHRDGELVLPAQFLPVAEESSLIVDIGRQVLSQSCTDLRPRLPGDPELSVSVNVSATELRQVDFADRVLATIERMGLSPDRLTLEVTESLFLETTLSLVEQLTALRDQGVSVSIDDFGTGYSSLGRLQVLPVDSIKIDRTLVRELRTGVADLPILNSMVVMAHDLGLDVTAEGVETAEQARRLRALGCDCLQGFFFSRPVPPQHLAESIGRADATAGDLDLDLDPPHGGQH